jgi:hypothetical protein
VADKRKHALESVSAEIVIVADDHVFWPRLLAGSVFSNAAGFQTTYCDCRNSETDVSSTSSRPQKRGKVLKTMGEIVHGTPQTLSFVHDGRCHVCRMNCGTVITSCIFIYEPLVDISHLISIVSCSTTHLLQSYSTMGAWFVVITYLNTRDRQVYITPMSYIFRTATQLNDK